MSVTDRVDSRVIVRQEGLSHVYKMGSLLYSTWRNENVTGDSVRMPREETIWDK